MTDPIAGQAGLIILEELARQSDGRLSDVVLMRVLDAHGVRRSRDWLRTQLRRLVELDAVRTEEMGVTIVAQLRAAGRDHVERRRLLDGIARPADLD